MARWCCPSCDWRLKRQGTDISDEAVRYHPRSDAMNLSRQIDENMKIINELCDNYWKLWALHICQIIDALCNVCTKCRETGQQLISKVFFQVFDIQHRICQYLSMLVQWWTIQDIWEYKLVIKSQTTCKDVVNFVR